MTESRPTSTTITEAVLSPEEISYTAEAGVIQPEESAVQAAQERLKIGRNERCPCGSGRKYKVCCRARDMELVHQGAARRAALQQTTMKPQETRTAAEPPEPPDPPRQSPPPPRERDPLMEKRDALWVKFEALKSPTGAQMEELLEGLLALPPDYTAWSEVMHALAGHEDLPGVFRRIAAAIPDTVDPDPDPSNTDMAYLCWAAAAEFGRHGLQARMHELVAYFCRLDGERFASAAFEHLEEILLAEGCEAELLQLAGHFAARSAQGAVLPGYDKSEQYALIFELRAGMAVQSGPGGSPSVQDVVRKLRQGQEDNGDLRSEYADSCAAVICGLQPDPAWTRADFEMKPGKETRRDQEYLRIYTTLLRVARETAREDGVRAGSAFRGLSQLLYAFHTGQADEEGRKRSKQRAAANLLDCLAAATIDARLAENCRELAFINRPRARLLLDAHETLLRFALRHQLVPAKDAQAGQAEIERLRDIVTRVPAD